jgi:hypothetical protein
VGYFDASQVVCYFNVNGTVTVPATDLLTAVNKVRQCIMPANSFPQFVISYQNLNTSYNFNFESVPGTHSITLVSGFKGPKYGNTILTLQATGTTTLSAIFSCQFDSITYEVPAVANGNTFTCVSPFFPTAKTVTVALLQNSVPSINNVSFTYYNDYLSEPYFSGGALVGVPTTLFSNNAVSFTVEAFVYFDTSPASMPIFSFSNNDTNGIIEFLEFRVINPGRFVLISYSASTLSPGVPVSQFYNPTGTSYIETQTALVGYRQFTHVAVVYSGPIYTPIAPG